MTDGYAAEVWLAGRCRARTMSPVRYRWRRRPPRLTTRRPRRIQPCAKCGVARGACLRALSAVGSVALIGGWLVWLRIYNTIDLVSATPYRIGTFLLTVGAVLSAFCFAIALTHRATR